MQRKTTKPRQWLRLTIAEPFPVFFSHANMTDKQKAQGPHYAANSQWYAIATDRNRRTEEHRAAYLRHRGYTVTLETVTR